MLFAQPKESQMLSLLPSLVSEEIAKLDCYQAIALLESLIYAFNSETDSPSIQSAIIDCSNREILPFTGHEIDAFFQHQESKSQAMLTLTIEICQLAIDLKISHDFASEPGFLVVLNSFRSVPFRMMDYWDFMSLAECCVYAMQYYSGWFSTAFTDLGYETTESWIDDICKVVDQIECENTKSAFLLILTLHCLHAVDALNKLFTLPF